jgi:hypothetical protein
VVAACPGRSGGEHAILLYDFNYTAPNSALTASWNCRKFQQDAFRCLSACTCGFVMHVFLALSLFCSRVYDDWKHGIGQADLVAEKSIHNHLDPDYVSS